MKPTWESDDGRAKLFCADCRNVLANGEIGDGFVVITDPPYGIEGGKGGQMRLAQKADYEGDWKDDEKYIQDVVFPVILLCKDLAIRMAITPGNRNLMLYPKPDDIGVFWHPAAARRGPWGFSLITPILYYGKDPRAGLGSLPTGIQVTERSEKNGHPCPKPIKAWTWLVNKVSLEGETIFDPFMGSGTTGVAAIRLGRKFIGVEINPDYFEIAKARIQHELSLGRLANLKKSVSQTCLEDLK